MKELTTKEDVYTATIILAMLTIVIDQVNPNPKNLLKKGRKKLTRTTYPIR